MFSLCDLRFLLCSRDLDVLCAQRFIGFFVLITHKPTRSGNPITVDSRRLSVMAAYMCHLVLESSCGNLDVVVQVVETGVSSSKAKAVRCEGNCDCSAETGGHEGSISCLVGALQIRGEGQVRIMTLVMMLFLFADQFLCFPSFSSSSSSSTTT